MSDGAESLVLVGSLIGMGLGRSMAKYSNSIPDPLLPERSNMPPFEYYQRLRTRFCTGYRVLM